MAASHLSMLLLLLDLSPVSVASAEQPRLPIIKRQPPSSHDKILAEHLEFALSPSPPSPLEYADTARFFLPAFAPHQDDVDDDGGDDDRARSLSQRAYCPAGMNSCDSSGSPTKCCPEGTHCQLVPDTDVGHIACCPSGSTCGGGVGQCPAGAVSCAASLGGGCCIAGYVCQGDGCVLSASATHAIETLKSGPRVTISSTKTIVSGSSSSRPTSQVTTDAVPESSSPLTQMGCPTGFYGCLAVHQGGCCRTERDCHTYSCPPLPPATTLVSGGVTVVVPASGPAESTSPTDGKSCAGGWYLCSKDDGVAPGCCPSGYECGSASCFPAGATATATSSGVPKQAPDKSAASRAVGVRSLWSAVVMTLLSLAGFSL